MSDLTISLFGHPAIALDGAPVALRGRKAVALLAYLAATRRRHSREALAALLWPEDPAALSRLRQALWALRQAGLGPWLLADREAVAMGPGFTLDVEAFEAACTAGRLEAAAERYGADFLAGLALADAPAFDEWQLYEAERLRQLLARALERLAEELGASGAYEEAIAFVRRRLALDPLHEPAHRALMRLYALAGQQSAALRQYEACARLLAAELGVAPEEETRALHEQIRRRELRRPPEATAPPSARPAPDGDAASAQGDAVAPNAEPPAGRHRLLGREAELATLEAMLGAGRLITIVGPGGIGKTRLALAAAEAQRGQAGFAEVRVVELASLAAHEQLVPTLAAALGIQLGAGREERDPRRQLLDALAHRRILLVLDNFEQLLGGADLVADILRAAPGAAVLATSRERLGLHAEQILALRGLAVPEDATAAQIDAAPAAQLFIAAARRVAHDFALAPDDRPHLAEICRLVAGMPLALELAATWAELLPLSAIAAEIRGGIDLLATEAVDLPERQRSIRAVCRASWQRLAPELRGLFASLAVCRGGFPGAGARGAAAAPPAGLARLAHASLVTYDRERERYHLHELLRQYAAEQLARDGAAERAARDRHAAHFCGLLRRLGADLRGPRQQAALDQIDAEGENVRAAWAWAAQTRRWDDLAGAADCLGYAWKWRAAFEDGLALFGAAAARLTEGEAGPREGRQALALAALLAWQSNFARLLGRRDQADRLLDRTVALLDEARRAGERDDHVRAFALLQLGQAAHDAGRPEARALYEQSRDACTTPDTRWEQSAALVALGRLAHDQGAFAEAEAQFAAGLALRQACGDQRGVAYALELWSQTAAEAGRPGEAEALARRSNSIYQALGDQVSSATGLGKLGVIQMWLGSYAEARATLADSLARYLRLGNQAAIGRARCRLGLALGALGVYDEAHAEVRAGMAALRGVGKPLDLAWGQWVAGSVLIGMGALPEAEAALEESVAHYRASGHLGQIGWSLALLAHLALARGEEEPAQAHLLEVLRGTRRRRDFLALAEALPAAALLLGRRGRPDRALELHALAAGFPVLANSQVYAGILGAVRHELAAALPAEVAAAAEARGRALDPWRTAEGLPDELAAPGATPAGAPVAGHPLRLDEEARELLVAGERVGLAPLEFGVLRYLVEREGKAVSRAALLADVWGYSYEGGSNVVDAVVRTLRRKLGPHAAAIETVTKVGYRFRPPA